LIGDALELIVYKALDRQYVQQPRFAYLGHFDLSAPKNAEGRYVRVQPPKSIAGHSTIKEADFLLFGHDAGPLCIECKSYREWLYRKRCSAALLAFPARQWGFGGAHSQGRSSSRRFCGQPFTRRVSTSLM
jgi:hypothetical protein